MSHISDSYTISKVYVQINSIDRHIGYWIDNTVLVNPEDYISRPRSADRTYNINYSVRNGIITNQSHSYLRFYWYIYKWI